MPPPPPPPFHPPSKPGSVNNQSPTCAKLRVCESWESSDRLRGAVGSRRAALKRGLRFTLVFCAEERGRRQKERGKRSWWSGWDKAKSWVERVGVYFCTFLIGAGRGNVPALPRTMASCWEAAKGRGAVGAFREGEALGFLWHGGRLESPGRR